MIIRFYFFCVSQMCSSWHEGYSCSNLQAIQKVTYCTNLCNRRREYIIWMWICMWWLLCIIYALVYTQKLEVYNSFEINKLRTFRLVKYLGLWPVKHGLDVACKNIGGSSTSGSQQRSHIFPHRQIVLYKHWSRYCPLRAWSLGEEHLSDTLWQQEGMESHKCRTFVHTKASVW